MVNAGAGALETWAWSVSSRFGPSRLADALKVIKDELIKIKRTGFGQLLDSKNNIAGRTELAMEDSSAQANGLPSNFGLPIKCKHIEQVTNKIRQVTARSKKLANKLFDLNQMRVR